MKLAAYLVALGIFVTAFRAAQRFIDLVENMPEVGR